ncbi:11482_t:CDS:2, partial [Funneliformis geosporum]
AYAVKRDMVISTRVPKNIEKGKYPGAYVFPSKKGIESRRPVIGLDFASLYPTWCVRHDNQTEKKGLYSVVLEDLANKRLELKARLVPLEKKKQHFGKMISSAKESDYWDLKQKTLKVYMNTFYREAGNSLSSIYLRELACRTTTLRKYYLNFVAKFVSKKAFFREELFKEAYWTEMVKITMNVMSKLRNQVNAYLRIKSGTSYLKIAYEEVLFPICFTGKKKYFGIEHEDIVNFKLKNLFMKGIYTVKQ